jgi:hypothetical protein
VPRLRILVLALLGSAFVPLACASSGGGADPDPAPSPTPPSWDQAAVEQASAAITPEAMRAHIAYLASDELGGRGTPSPGLEMAAEYIADQFSSYGLRPAGDAGTYIQRYRYEKATLRHEAISLTYQADDELHSLQYGADFFVIPADQERVEGEAVYLGTATDVRTGFPPEVAGKIALVLIPPTGPGEGFDAQRTVRDAADAGALAFVLIFPPGVPEQAIAANVAETQTNQPFLGVPLIGMLYGGASAMLAAAGLDFDALWQQDSTPKTPVSLSGVSLTLKVPLDRVSSEPPNVVALIPGSDPELSNTYVVYTAHLDGLGIGPPDASGDSIYNGANDDASGTAALLEIARTFASLPQPPARSVVFLSVSGEEVGFLGSHYFVSNPTVPAAGMVANLNIECIARGTDSDEYEVGEKYVTLGPLARQVVEDHPSMRLTNTLDLSDHPFFSVETDLFRSDHGSFAVAGIPFFMFGGGLTDDLHQPSDEIERLDLDRAAQVARLYFTLGTAIANDPTQPGWKEGGLEHIREMLYWF